MATDLATGTFDAATTREIERERLRRRTFAIISHPDAGKTTLTEKLLLFGGSIEVAGAVRGRKTERAATSDWMELEKQRGISVSSTALTFEYAECQINLLDTPGHHDFSEDTYRTLMAADAAVMVLDIAKGIESQTEKLFRVCALRKIPVVTFVNKIDRPGRSPLDILDEIERKFSIAPVPQNWPLGSGNDFQGLVDLARSDIHLFADRSRSRRISSTVATWSDLLSSGSEDTASLAASTREEIELVQTAGATLNSDSFLRGEQTPVFFGSALSSFGVEQFLRGFLKLCPPPGGRPSSAGVIPPDHPAFSGFIFKVQANLDPRHRDRVAFVRVCTGRFERDMEVAVSRTGKKIRLPRALRIFGQDRQTMDVAYPGDIIGVVSPGDFQLGDTLCQPPCMQYEPLPQFSPEFFAVLDCKDTLRRKQFDRGIAQLIEEGAIQAFHDPKANRRELILAAVGELQFDVVQFRLESEYKATTSLSWKPYKLARWFSGPPEALEKLRVPYSGKLVQDQLGYTAVLLQSEWDEKILREDNPDLRFAAVRVSSYNVNAIAPPASAS